MVVSALQTLLQGNHSTLRRTGLMEYPGFTTPAPKGFVDVSYVSISYLKPITVVSCILVLHRTSLERLFSYFLCSSVILVVFNPYLLNDSLEFQDGDRFNAPYSNKHSLDNVARNYVDKSKGPAGIPPPLVAWMPPKKPIQTTSQFSNSCLGYDRPMPFFNPLPAEDCMGRAVEIYHGICSLQAVHFRDI